MSDAPQFWSVCKMHGMATVSRLSTTLAITVAFICAERPATARDTTHGLSIATVSNGVVTYKIPTGPEGLELSSNAPGTITITSGSNAVTVRGPAVKLSGDVVLAPYSTPGVHVVTDDDGGYTAVLDTVLSMAPDPEMPEDAASRLAQELAQILAREFADADFGDGAGRCLAPAGNQMDALTRSESPGFSPSPNSVPNSVPSSVPNSVPNSVP